MVVIPLAVDFLEKVLDGRKTSTIRLGKRPYPVGKGVLIMDGRKILIEIENTRFCSTKDLTEIDARKDGFDNLRELNQQLRRFYPNIVSSDHVTIVEFKIKEKSQ